MSAKKMNTGTRIGLSNIQISTDGENYTPLGVAQNITFETNEINQEILDEFKMITTPTEISMKLYSSKHNGQLSKCLYYMKSKNKRIRRKHAKKMYRLLGGI